MESISWKLIETYFKDNTGPLVAHHLDSYNDFFQYGIQKIFKENNPFRFVEPSTKEGSGNSECHLYLGGRDGTMIHYGKPVIYDDNRTHYMYPNEARLRNMTYGVTIHYDVVVDIIQTKEDGTTEQQDEITLEKIYILFNSISRKEKVPPLCCSLSLSSKYIMKCFTFVWRRRRVYCMYYFLVVTYYML